MPWFLTRRKTAIEAYRTPVWRIEPRERSWSSIRRDRWHTRWDARLLVVIAVQECNLVVPTKVVAFQEAYTGIAALGELETD